MKSNNSKIRIFLLATTCLLPVLVAIFVASKYSLKTPFFSLMGNLSSCGIDLQKVKADIKKLVEEDMKKRNDGTSLIGTFVRLSWHCSGTYSKEDGTGGSNGGRIRFQPEKSWGANAGLDIAMEALEPIKHSHPNLSYADLYTLSGVVAVEMSGGPEIPFKLGREDFESGDDSPEDGRLPDADKGSMGKTTAHMRDIFGRLGFTDREMVCLIGAHTLGRCHTDRSGYWGPWNKAENKFNNALFKFLLDMKWTVKKTHEGKKWKGPLQYENPSGELMMLPSCIAMTKDKKMLEYVKMYAEDEVSSRCIAHIIVFIYFPFLMMFIHFHSTF